MTVTTTYKRDPQNSNTSTSTSSAPESSASITACQYSWLAKYFQDGRHHRRQQPLSCSTDSLAESQTGASTPGQTLSSSSAPVIIFNQALQQSPNVAMAMWPSTINPATSTLADLPSANLANTDGYAPILTAGLQLIMNDVGTFIAFAGNGLFSTPIPSGIEPSAYGSGYTGALDTYLLSQVLAANSVSATPGAIAAANPCVSGPLCSSSYWSPVTGRQYSFTGSNTFSLVNSFLALNDADLPVLFDGAYNCTYVGQAGGSVVGLQADGSLNVACLSVLPMYVDGGCPDGAVQVGGKCPFGSSS